MIAVLAGWPPRKRLVVLLIAIAIVVVLLAAPVLTGGRSSRREGATSPAVSRPTFGTSAPRPLTSAAPPAHVHLPALARSDDPVAYAKQVATALFDVNTAIVTRAEFLQFWRGELPTVVYSDAAAKGLTVAAQNADVIDNLTTAWIPPQPAWDSEAADRTTNRFTITSVSVPDYWVNAVADGTFRDPGLHMERVMGVLTQRYGSDPAHRQASSRSVVIDLGLLCGPTQPGGCRLVAPQQPPELGDS